MGFLWRGICGALLLFGAFGCARKESAAVETQPASALRRIAFQTDWFPQAEHGGFYQALEKGYYREAGLEVDILPGGPGAGIKLKVARGDADFGMLKSDDVIVSSARGMPLVMIMATMQHDPQALLVHADSPVKTLRDLDGRTVSAAPGMTWIPAVQKKYGIQFNLVPHTYGMELFLANSAAIQQCIVTSEPFIAQQRGKKVRTLSLAESGYDCYPVVFSRRELLRDRPEVARAFVAASIRGWRDYLENDPAPAHALILRRNAQMTAELLAFSRGEMIRLSLVQGDRAKGEDIGRLSLERIADQMQTLLEFKVLDASVAVSSVVRTDFLPTADQP